MDTVAAKLHLLNAYLEWTRALVEQTKSGVTDLTESVVSLQQYNMGLVHHYGFDNEVELMEVSRAFEHPMLLAATERNVQERIQSLETVGHQITHAINMINVERQFSAGLSHGQTVPADHLQEFAKRLGLAMPLDVDSAFLNAEEDANEWVVEGIIQTGQSTIIAGPSKCLKTTTTISLGVSIATGKPFLGIWNVPKPRKVLIASVEARPKKFKSVVKSTLSMLELTADDLGGNLSYQRWLPTSGTKDADKMIRAFLVELCKSKGIEVLILDPAYRMLSGLDQGNIKIGGNELGRIVDGIQDAIPNITIIVNDHTKSHTNEASSKPLELAQLSGAATAAFYRQWLLLCRAEPYRSEGDTATNKLWLTVGSDSVTGSKYALEVVENHKANILRAKATDYAKATEQTKAMRAYDKMEAAAKREEEGRIEFDRYVQKLTEAVEPGKQYTAADMSAKAIFVPDRKRQLVIQQLVALGVLARNKDGRNVIYTAALQVSNQEAA